MSALASSTGSEGWAHSSLASDTALDVLQLIRSENVGSVTFFHLLSFYGSAAKALEALPELARKGGQRRKLKRCERADAEAEMEATQAAGADMVTYGSLHYPALLHTIPDAPPLLIMKGNPALLKERSIIGMVGARNGSANGCQFARKLARDLGERGFLTASGLARGIDTAVHVGSLATGTIAVTACGIDQIYPPENANLHAELCEKGLVITEHAIGKAPHARAFPARNRIIAGISAGLVVVEASHKSGSLITANYALDYGRDVFAVPGSPLDPRCKGTNGLIKQGAQLTESADDVCNNLSTGRDFMLQEPVSRAFNAAPVAVEPDETSRAKLLEKLSPTPVLVDELLSQCEITPNLCYMMLLELELAGRLQRHAGGRVSLRMPDEEL
ncbi:MAG: DNA-protecting protein DprA [Rickettsiales bacterium]|nr:DNA-protecting protein DprA [Rickettsiales bacterium]